jgi:hypothetical protein
LNGFTTRPGDLKDLPAENCSVLILPPMSVFSAEEKNEIRRLHKDGVSLLCAEDCSGLEDIFGVKKAEPVQVSLINGLGDMSGMEDTTDEPLCVSCYSAGKAKTVLTGFDNDGRETPVLTLRRGRKASAAFYTVPPSAVRRADPRDLVCYGRPSVSSLMNLSAARIMRSLSAPAAETSRGSVIGFTDTSGKTRVIVSEDANPAPSGPVSPVVVIRGKNIKNTKIDCDHDFAVTMRAAGEIRLRLHLGENESAVITLHQ